MENKIQVRPYSKEQEKDRIDFYRKNESWYLKNGYNFSHIKLPESDEFQYLPNSYEKKVKSINKAIPSIRENIDKILDLDINVYIHDAYNIFVSHYGTLGSYNPKGGDIIMRSDSPKNEAIVVTHEIIHLLIEETIVKKYNLSQQEKEAVVDALCFYVIPIYQIQSISNKTLFNAIATDNYQKVEQVVKKFKE